MVSSLLRNGEHMPLGQAGVGVVLTTDCNHGYHLSSTDEVRCVNTEEGAAAQWSTHPPTCGKSSLYNTLEFRLQGAQING